MEGLVPWARQVALITPFYPKGGRGRPPLGVEKMLRMYFLQQWYALADEALEDTLYDSQALRTFVGIDLGGGEAVPDATTLLHFRHLLERHALTRRNAQQTQRSPVKTQVVPLTQSPSTARSLQPPSPSAFRTKLCFDQRFPRFKPPQHLIDCSRST